MDRSRQHIEGYRHGTKDAVQWLMEWANRDAYDPHAKQIVFMLAAHMGDHFKRVAGLDKRGRPPPPKRKTRPSIAIRKREA